MGDGTGIAPVSLASQAKVLLLNDLSHGGAEGSRTPALCADNATL